MKNTLIIFLLCLAFNLTAKNNFCEITGQYQMKFGSKVELFKIEYGKLVSHSKTELDAEGRFGFLLTPEKEGFYYLGNEKDYIRIYLKKEDNLNILINKDGYELRGKLSKENKTLYEWYQMSKYLYDRSAKRNAIPSTFKDFFPELERVSYEAKEFSNEVKTGNANFDQLMKYAIDWDLKYYAILHIMLPHALHPKAADYIDYYKDLHASFILDNELIFELPYFNRLVDVFVTYNFIATKEQPTAKNRDELHLKVLKDKVVRGEFYLNMAQKQPTYAYFKSVVDAYGQYMTTKRHDQLLFEKELTLRSFNKGDEAYEFSFPDEKGNLVTMDDFKGKLVLLDFWATWCVPCVKQISYLTELEKKYKGRDDIVFLSISVDKDKEAWLKRLKRINNHCVQLNVDGNNKISMAYGIRAVPHFMLFDKEGKIISAKAPMASDPKLVELINAHLNTTEM